MLLFLPHKRKKGNEIMRSYPKRLLLHPPKPGRPHNSRLEIPKPGSPEISKPGSQEIPKTRDSITSQPRRPGKPLQPTLN